MLGLVLLLLLLFFFGGGGGAGAVMFGCVIAILSVCLSVSEALDAGPRGKCCGGCGGVYVRSPACKKLGSVRMRMPRQVMRVVAVPMKKMLPWSGESGVGAVGWDLLLLMGMIGSGSGWWVCD
jgi:hypothetical protein